MPEVSLDMDIRASIDTVWAAVLDIERYPEVMTNVVSVNIEEWEEPTVRRTEWAMIIKGATLVWRDREFIDHDKHTVRFTQVSGDLERFEGAWELDEKEQALTHVRLRISFEIGVPLLAPMLNPVARRALYDNATEMLEGVDSQATVS
ncbi:MAG TPA: SRPBCC family protein [Thermoleophilaceae bacterium]|jgi:ribosome-associated toxin RatA of RatAB toxin-antitoxin module